MVRIAIAKEYFIPVRLRPLKAGLYEHIDRPEEWDLFCQLIENLYHTCAHKERQSLKDDFYELEPYTAGGRQLASKLAASERIPVEDHFLESFSKAMRKANYNLLTQRDWQVCLDEGFSFLAKVVIHWDNLERQPISRFLLRHAHEMTLFEHASNVLVFHRAVGSASLTGRFIPEKINLLLSYVADGIMKRLSAGQAGSHENKSEVSSDKVEYMERANLTHVLPTVMSVICSFPKTTTISEPTFKDVVLVYFDQKQDDDSVLTVKSFSQIPMADLEVVFPHKEVQTQPKDKVMLLVAAVMALIAAIKAHFSAETGWAMIGVIVLLAMKMFQMFQNMRKMKADTMAKMVESLFVNSRDEGLGVVHHLIDSSEEQDVKEVLLAYCILLRNGQLTEKEIVEKCEDYMHRNFSTAISFEGDDALAKLLDLGLVTSDVTANGSYAALSLEDAIGKLKAYSEQPPLKRRRVA